MPAVEVRDVHKRFDEVRALDGVSLTVPAGSSFALLGPNGAGKTTLFKLLLGLDRPDEGDVDVLGYAPEEGPALRERVGYLPESVGFPETLTGREVLAFHAEARDIPPTDRPRRVQRVLATVGLADAADRGVGGYSKGMTRRLGLGTTLLREPDILLLDEPTAGLDPAGVEAFHGIVDPLARRDDVTVVFSTHALSEVEPVCEEAAILHEGRVAASGRIEDLRQKAGEAVTVRARFGTARQARQAAGRLAESPKTRGAEVAGRSLEVPCRPSAAYGVLRELHEGEGPDRFEVVEPGLDAVFRAVVEDPVEANR